MSILSIPQDCFRLICLRLDYADIIAIRQTCHQCHAIISPETFWMTMINQNFGISPITVTAICEKYTLTPQKYYRLYQTTRVIDRMMRSWFAPEDMPRFYSAIVRFFNNMNSVYEAWKGHRISRTSGPDDIWIYGQANSGKSEFATCVMMMGFNNQRPMGFFPVCHTCKKTGNRLIRDYEPPQEKFVGSVFEFKNVFPDEYNVDDIYPRSYNRLRDYFFVLETLYTE